MMTIADLVKKLVALGATPEMIEVAVVAVHERDSAMAEKRSAAAERKRRQRDSSRDSHGTVTGQSRDVSRDSHGQKKGLPQTPSKENIPPDSLRESPPKAEKRGSRLPRDWRVSESDRQFAIDAGLCQSDVDRIAGTFRDYWVAQPGQKGVKLDWPATWRNWCRREVDRGRSRSRDGPSNAGEQTQSQRIYRKLMGVGDGGTITIDGNHGSA